MSRIKDEEKKLFLYINLPSLKRTVTEDVKGRLLYAMSTGNISDDDLMAAFPKEYPALLEVMDKKPFIRLFDKTNYVFKYFFTIHNEVNANKVLPAQIVGFKAERKAGKNLINATVKYYDDRVENTSLKVFPGIELKDFKLNEHVLINNDSVCYKLSEKEYDDIIKNFFTN